MSVGIGGLGGTVVGVLWGLNLLSGGVIGVRLYTRLFLKGQTGADDWAIVVTWLLMVIFAALTTASAEWGLGQHYDDLSTDEFKQAMIYELCAQFIVSLAIGMAKVVVALFLLRIVTAKWQKWTLWFCIVTMMAFSLLLSIAIFAQCTPVEAIWDPLLADEKVCHLSLTVIAFIDCTWAAVLDFFLALFPWIALRNLNMKKKEKFTICASLSLGIFAGICGIIRTSTLEALSNSTDYLYATSNSVIWTASEVTTTLVCVSVPAFRPLYKHIRGLDSTDGRTGGYLEQRDEQHSARTRNSDIYGLKSLGTRNGTRNDDLDYNKHIVNIERTRTRERKSSMDEGSDRSILAHASPVVNASVLGGIRQQHEVSITYEQASDVQASHA